MNSRTLYRRRSGAESINRHLDDTLWLWRAHSVGARRQLLNLITYAIGVKAMSMQVHRQGLAPPITAWTRPCNEILGSARPNTVASTTRGRIGCC